jgi:purine-binding chemotaxis protein CheW
MELAKIRNKARQQSADAASEDQFPDYTAAAVPPALSLSETARDELVSDYQPLPSSFPGPVVVRPIVPAPRFDPLAVILSGREHDRVGIDRADSEPEEESTVAAVERTFEEFLCFRLGEEEYGVNIMEIKEIIKPRELTEVPRTPDFVDGVLSLRGVIVPVFDMRKRLAMSLAYDKSQERIIIVRCGEGLNGLRVDRVTDVVRIAEGGREATPSVLEGIAREFVGGIGRSDGRMIIILDICKVVDTALGEVF